MKSYIKRFLQFILGFERYLFYFSRYIAGSLHRNKREGDFIAFVKLLKDGETVLDIGANIGAMSVYLAKHLPHSRIIAFEPIPVNVRVFKKVIQHYKLSNVELIEKALGERDGMIEMVLPNQKHVKMHGLCHVVHESITELNDGDRFQLPMVRLDAVEEVQSAGRISGIKIDVENYEQFVLTGAKEVIEKNRPVIYAELWENENRNQCFRFITELGYQIHVLSDQRLVPFDAGVHHQQNFFFIPSDRS